jgi:RND family efflux transporter MFP subunit
MKYETNEAETIETNDSQLDSIGKKPRSLFNKMKLRVATSIAVALLIAGGMTVQFSSYVGDEDAQVAASRPPAAPVVVAQATRMTIAPHTLLPGTVISTRDAVISSEATGKVLAVALVGAIVTKGEQLAQIDPENAKQLVAQRKAALARLRSLFQYHKDYFARVNLEDNKLGIPEIGVAELRSNMETAKADMQSAEVALQSAELNLERTSITAPFSGRVVSQSIQLGEYAQIGSSIVRLVDTDNLEISARVPAALVQSIEKGRMLDVSGMGKTLRAPMRALVPVGDTISRTMELRVSLTQSGLLVGSAVRVSLPSATPKDVVAIPRDAVVLRTNAQYVFVVNQEGVASRRNIELGFAQGDMIEAIGQVEAGDTLVIRGGERLRDGQNVAWEKTDANVEVVSTL